MKLKIKAIILFLICSSAYAQIEVISTDSIRIIGSGSEGTGNFGVSSSSAGTNAADSVGRKRVYWIHGLSGDEASWQRVFHATRYQGSKPIVGYPVRKLEGFNLSYSHLEGSDLINAGRDYADMLKIGANNSSFQYLDSSKSFAIAHSQGGLMARSVRIANKSVNNQNMFVPSVYTGLATFGTPHAGAQIINSLNAGLVQNWIDEGCNCIAKGEIQTFLNSNWWLDAIISNGTVTRFSTKACNGLNKTALPILIDAIRKPISDNYAIGASELSQLTTASNNDSMPVVTFYGIEEEPVLWRTINSLTYTPDSVVTNASLLTDPFGLNDDEAMVQFVNHKISGYHFNWVRFTRNTNRGWYQFWGAAKEEQRKANIYKDAYNWLSTANLEWKRFIGARRDTTFTDGYQCDCLIDLGGTNGYSFTSTIVQNPNDCNTPNAINCITIPRERHEVIEEANDGVVTVSSQKAYPGKKVGARLMSNTNHMQMRNCMETRDALVLLFNGSYDLKFKLDQN